MELMVRVTNIEAFEAELIWLQLSHITLVSLFWVLIHENSRHDFFSGSHGV